MKGGPNHLLKIFQSLRYIYKFHFLAFPSAFTTFPSTFTRQQSIPQTLSVHACGRLSTVSCEPFLLLFSFLEISLVLSLAFTSCLSCSTASALIVFLIFSWLQDQLFSVKEEKLFSNNSTGLGSSLPTHRPHGRLQVRTLRAGQPFHSLSLPLP